MASGPLGAGGVGGDAPREKHRWAESKVYTRKFFKSSSKSNPNSQNNHHQQQQNHQETPKRQPQQPPPPQAPSEDANSAPQPPGQPAGDRAAPENDASSLNNNHRADPPDPAAARENGVGPPPPPLVTHLVENGELHRVIDFGLAARAGPEVRELRRKLGEELEQVRGLIRRLEARERQLAPPPPLPPTPTAIPAYNSHPQPVVPSKRPATNSDPGSTPLLQRQLSTISPRAENHSTGENLEKEKRTPKANQFYRSSDFITGKDRFPPADSHKKSKANGAKKGSAGVDSNTPAVGGGIDKAYVQAFKSCLNLLTRLMKHKHGWVFNSPVDAKGLGLYDYHLIIKHPMDLGTVKSRLTSNWYKSPREFAEDVRLTFHNAMTYNPKGQDVHIMAEQLLKIFEDKWQFIEAEFAMVASYSMAMVPKKLLPPPLDMRRILERSDSTAHLAVMLEPTPRTVSHTPHSTRQPALKKPKAKDVNKRDMTFDEKQKLSSNLQNLPSEKLDIVVQIIKKRNSSLSQHDDEIEVDIDSVDTETLWELDRFVTNYKKSLSKHKRKAELALQAKQEAERNAQKLQNQAAAVAEVPVEGKTDEKNAGYSSPVAADKVKGDNESLSSSSCSSSSDSGSSSSDSDSESSSS